MKGLFQITQRKGFRIRFNNGYAISVQWGPGNYCESRDKYPAEIRGSVVYAPEKDIPSTTAEVAIYDPAGDRVTPQFIDCGSESVKGWARPEEVADLMQKVAAMKYLKPLEA
jgi:hypothetical protein